jgi:hypothetical protein
MFSPQDCDDIRHSALGQRLERVSWTATRNRDGGFKVKINETSNVIMWLKRNVGGKGIN